MKPRAVIAVTTGRVAGISEHIARRVLELRQAADLTREQLADAARMAGASDAFTASALRNIETGRRRDLTVDELLALARALDVPPLALLGDHAEAFGVAPPPSPPAPEPCRRCTGAQSGVQAAVREDIDALGDLVGVEASLAQTAYRLAQAIDEGGGEDGRQLPALAKELRATLKELTGGRVEGDGDDDLGDLGSPD